MTVNIKSRGRMSGGTEWEQGQAVTRMVAAMRENNPDAMALALADYAAALGTRVTSSMAAMVQIVLKRMDEHDCHDLDYRAGFRQHIDDRFDAYSRELDVMRAELQSTVRLAEMIADHERRIVALEAVQDVER